VSVKPLLGLALLCACSAGPDLPDGWGAARPLPLVQSTCSAAPAPGLPRLTVTTATDGTMTAMLATYGRCQQSACGYVLDAASTTKILVQPCDMHPSSVNKCACTAEVTFTLPPSAQRQSVEVWWRPDFYGLSGANEPTLIPAR
jgi:hypothetical protein